ncbi:MAG: hypothetical protein KAI03_07090 [Candidatus Aureabacteria bacterium]|nr:hypothetical protein [Candidatus Auribacterota bacterium]
MNIGKLMDASPERVIISGSSVHYILYSLFALIAVNAGYIYLVNLASYIHYILYVLGINVMLLLIPGLLSKKIRFDNCGRKLFIERFFLFFCVQDKLIPYDEIDYLGTDFIDLDLSKRNTVGDTHILYLYLKEGKRISMVTFNDPSYFSEVTESIRKYTEFELKRV